MLVHSRPFVLLSLLPHIDYICAFLFEQMIKCDCFFTARCTIVQSVVLLSLLVCPSVRLWRWWIMTTQV